MRFEEQEIGWNTWDGDHAETLRVRFENGGWTAEGTVGGVDISYVLRFTEAWEVRQFLLFRDLEDPDLWLATDGLGTWGETNGVVRDDLDGCVDIALACTPFTTGASVRRLQASGLTEHRYRVALIDVETLGITVHEQSLHLVADDQWHHESHTTGYSYQFTVDESGFIVDEPGRFRRSHG